MISDHGQRTLITLSASSYFRKRMKWSATRGPFINSNSIVFNCVKCLNRAALSGLSSCFFLGIFTVYFDNIYYGIFVRARKNVVRIAVIIINKNTQTTPTNDLRGAFGALRKGRGSTWDAMPAKRMTATTATTTRPPPQPVAGVSSHNSISGGGGAARPLEMLNGMTRLTPARDLTLGGRGAGSKKIFAPNLNAVRNKNVNVKTSKDFTQARGGKRGGRGTASGATRGRGGNSTLIQTTGLFSEGAGVAQLRRSTGNGTAYARASEEQAVARKRTDRKDDKAQALRVRALLGESDASEGDASDASDTEADKTELALKPILLKEGLWLTQKPIVKREDGSLGSNQQDPLAMAQHLQQLHVSAQTAVMEEPPPQYGRYPRSIGGFLDAPQSQIFLMQLPDVLPCVTDEAEEGSREAPKKEEASAASETEPKSPAAPASTGAPRPSVLRQLEEGQIGKILRYRSGRVKLLLGDTHFDLDIGLDSGFLQELMSVTANREQRSGNMINLGPIQAKIKATPDWVHLFEQQEASRRSASTAPSTSMRPPTT